ncbi:TPA: hypothetical protein DDZ10_02910 [Candidatus Uhrbacteria bacterium]|nr:MAG: hypothetical protein UY79_C0001G0064 [Parcubacteria group bacterium GW2011_GWA2_53_21]OGL72094.1 MAG: hypothetical protein A3D69_01535 [Candidatus Uhrbacteria bacterium RIFCSPHIGHO2_02_FULL_54_11]HBL39598.1 hypothetical protein [Candidatus Uhrbacteria bacterium]
MKHKKNDSKQTKRIPWRASLFWDADPKTIDPQKQAKYVIERVLDFGTDEEVRWLWKTYSRPVIRRVVSTSRVLHPETRTLWSVLAKK